LAAENSVELNRTINGRKQARARHRKRKKADVVEHPEVIDHVGLLVDRSPGVAGLPFI
jgi:hypothetical protein